LVPGKKADIILVRTDQLNMAPLNVADGQIVLAAQPRNVDTVWIDGKIRKQNGSLLGVDESALCADATKAVRALSERIGEPVI
jgi:cytosine/adenosine deaminase-related metal-dependent hydrolase